MSYLAVPVISFSIPKAGDYIDASAASVTNDMPTRVRLIKENTFVFGGGGTPVFPPNASVYYRVTVQSTGPRNTVSYAQALILF